LVTVVGHVAKEPQLRVTASGARVTGFRLASTERRFNREINAWRDGETIFYAVTCWRTTAENVASSVKVGQPLVVHGRLRDGSYDDKEGQRRTVFEIEAYALGHDLSRGVATFVKAGPASGREQHGVVEVMEEDEPFDPATGEILDGERERRQPVAGESAETASEVTDSAA
jgi:single-strand DNA-binding protein